MTWLILVVSYFFLVWLFLRFFQFIANVDREIERLHNNELRGTSK